MEEQKKLNNYIDSLSKNLYNQNIEDVIYILDGLKFEDKNYILLNILNKYIRLINNCIENLSNDDNYFDKDLKEVILLEYNEYLDKYDNILNYYNELVKEHYKVKEEPKIENKPKKRKLCFLMSASGPYIEKDLDDISNHYYDMIIDTLDKYVNYELPQIYIQKFTGANDVLKEYFKLKYKNIRVICRHLSGGRTLILGALDKQETWGRSQYIKITSRDKVNGYIDDDEQNEELLNHLFNRLKQSKKKR